MPTPSPIMPMLMYLSGSVANSRDLFLAYCDRVANDGFDGLWRGNVQPYSQEVAPFQLTTELERWYPQLTQVVQPNGRVSADPSTDLNPQWFANQAVLAMAAADDRAGLEQAANATAVAHLAVLKDHASVRAWNVRDDTTGTALTSMGRLAAVLCDAFTRNDPLQRPCSAMWTDAGPNLNAYSVYQVGRGQADTYIYPYGRDAAGIPTPKGDTRRSTFGGLDYAAMMRMRIGQFPAGTPLNWCLQATQTTQPSATALDRSRLLRCPWPEEFAQAYFMALGEGAQAITWFIGTNDVQWNGLFHPDSAARYQAVVKLARRHRVIRPHLWQTKKTTDRFRTLGGGGYGYASAYCSTLLGLGSTPTVYVVVVNMDPEQAATITLTSDFYSGGTLVNVESGAATPIGSPMPPIAPLDGAVLLLG